MRLSDYLYDLPPAAIAQEPAQPRDASRLLVTDPMTDTVFRNLGTWLAAGDLLVVNDTRVRAARLHGRRPSGGIVELLLLSHREGRWEALARPSRKLRPGMELDFGPLTAEVTAVGSGGYVTVRLSGDGEVEDLIAKEGAVPLPPYITNESVEPARYQTVYADAIGAAAAPTAGLHFTQPLIEELERAGVGFASVSLNVGLDTFRPISAENVDEHVMHSEQYQVPMETVAAIDQVQAEGRRVIAVGTTTVRTLEAAAAGGRLASGPGATDLFIRPGFVPRVVDGLITNFHMPGSSLLVMISAFLPGWRSVYAHALSAGYRFLSFGDAMFIPRVRQ